jgi:hypothetical protein
MHGKRKGARSAAKVSTAKPKATGAKKKSSANGSKAQVQRRLRPGQLDGLVLGYMKKHKGELPLTPTKVPRGIKRSSGAVGNCLGGEEREGEADRQETAPLRPGGQHEVAQPQTSGPRRRWSANRGPDHKEAHLPMADEKSTDPGAGRRFRLNHEEDDRQEAAVLRRVLESNPDAFTKAELIRDMTQGGSADCSEVDANERAVRDLAAAGLLHPLGDGEFVRPTRAALRFFELVEEAG